MVATLLLSISAVLEIGIYCGRGLPRLRGELALVVILLLLMGSGIFFISSITLFSGLFLLISLYRTVNLLRVYEQRMHTVYLQHATRRTGLVLLVSQGIILIGLYFWQQWHTTGHGTWAVLGAVQLFVVLVMAMSARRSLARTAWQAPQKAYSDKELPSITVAIPARNETEDLQACLTSLIASDYPKLEIIVLDDCSQFRRTPEIIKGYAHDGVRFVQGEEPKDTWLAKNQAYDKLLQEASGAYIVFCGVDVRFAPGSLRAMVSTLLDRKKQMLCVLPLRDETVGSKPSVVQAIRYMWELALPRRIFNRPPVLSSCWAIETASLKKAGGFAAISRAIVPEAYFARRIIEHDGYSFRRADETLGIYSTKSIMEQRDTAVRMRYPQMHHRPEQTMLVTLLELTCLLAPLGILCASVFVSVGITAQCLMALATIGNILTYWRIARATHVHTGLLGLVLQPAAAAIDLWLLNYSMLRYEFGTVVWKGRNVCVPVMHVVQKLPPIQ